MHESLEESTQAKARELARQITVAHDLDSEIQEELYGHIEDKLLAYMSGEESVTEEDALLLVRKHFGDTRTLRSLLQDVHVAAVHVGMGRKVMALFITGGCVGAVAKAGQSLFNLGVFAAGIPLDFVVYKLFGLAFAVAMLAVLFSMLSRWKHAAASGNQPWYLHWPLSRLAVSVALVGLSMLAIPSVQVQHGGNTPLPLGVLMFVAMVGLLVASCAIWLWWVDIPPRQTRSLFSAGAMWLGLVLLGSLLPNISIHVGSGGPVAFGVAKFLNNHYGDVPITGFLTWGGPWRSVVDLGFVSGLYGLVTIISCFFYLGWQASLRRCKAQIDPEYLRS